MARPSLHQVALLGQQVPRRPSRVQKQLGAAPQNRGLYRMGVEDYGAVPPGDARADTGGGKAEDCAEHWQCTARL